MRHPALTSDVLQLVESWGYHAVLNELSTLMMDERNDEEAAWDQNSIGAFLMASSKTAEAALVLREAGI